MNSDIVPVQLIIIGECSPFIGVFNVLGYFLFLKEKAG
jgi:hypothetical protein